MSRVGIKPIEVAKGAKISVADRKVTVEGPKGTLSFEHRPEVSVAMGEGDKTVVVSVAEGYNAGDRQTRAYWGTTRALVANMIKGVTEGYKKSLEIVGVGWTAAVQGQNLKLVVGYANAIMMPIPPGLNVTVEKQIVSIEGPDKQAVGQFAAAARAKRKPEPYNGKGIKYTDEVIRRKEGKSV
ncbi:MAG: 50S ribosomal protein L6 [Planctomycetota bacterium]